MAKKKQYVWFIYGILGLRITDQGPALDKPMFRDATLLSKEHLMTLDSEFGPDHSRGKVLTEMAGPLDTPAYLGIRQAGYPQVSALGDPDTFGKRQCAIDKLRSGSVRRANIITALLSCNATPRKRQPCAVAHLRVHSPQQWLLFDTAHGFRGSGTQIDGVSWAAAPTADVPTVTRAQLLTELAEPPLRHLRRALVCKKPALSRDLHTPIIEAAISLSTCMPLGLPGPHLLGAVTAMEMLMSTGEQGVGKFKRLEHRVKALLGPEVARKYRIDDVFKARHDHVHNGLNPRFLLPLHASTLAIDCLLRYAELAFGFRSKRRLLNYLDLLHHGDQLACTWNQAEREAFQRLVKYERKPFPNQ